MKVSVTDATEFIGIALVNEFISQNFDVIAIARNANKLEYNSIKFKK